FNNSNNMQPRPAFPCGPPGASSPGPAAAGGSGAPPGGYPPMPPGGPPAQYRPGPPPPPPAQVGPAPPPQPPPPTSASSTSSSSSSRRGGGGGGGVSSQQRQSSGYMQPGGGGSGPYPPPRPPPQQQQQQQQQSGMPMLSAKRKRRHADRLLSERIQQLVPESSSYMELLKLEKKLDQVILRKKLAIQEAQKKPQKLRRKLRILISNQFNPGTDPSAEPGGPEPVVPNWEVRVEGRLVEDGAGDSAKAKRKFSSYFKSLVIELDKTLYGPDNHLVEWHRSPNTQETDGFQVKRPGDKPVKCTVLLMLDQQPPQFRLQPQLSRLLGIQSGTKAQILLAFWHYVKTKRLQDPQERSYIVCDTGMAEAFRLDPQQQPPPRLRFADVPQRLHQLLLPPDPIVINHLISNEPGAKKTACYEIEVEVDDPYKQMAHSFLVNTSSAQELAIIDAKLFDTIEQINQMAQHRDFFNQFTEDPRQFITSWLVSQKQDLKTMTDLVGNPEEERRAEFYQDSWLHEAATRYFSSKVTQRRQELEHALGIH
ncbi:hypothetical protein BOX15_Mlig011519g5, partial [Macrostomum lignano]